jgi:hypothetical protein
VDALAEFVLIKSAALVLISNFELALKTSNSPATVLLHLLAESFNQNVLEFGDLLGSLDVHAASTVGAGLALSHGRHRGSYFSLIISL